LSERAKQSADRGSNEMQEMMNSIQEIKKSSDQISKIIKVIDDIAFQTNILALMRLLKQPGPAKPEWDLPW
jgi:methyl-accepting chemotaxis protein